MPRRQPESLQERLDLYRTLLRRDGGISELNRLVDLLESELRGREPARDSRRHPASKRR